MSTAEETVNQSAASDEFFPTDSAPVTPATPDAHRGTIEGVSYTVFDSGWSCLDIAVKSDDVPGVSGSMRQFIPAAFVENIEIKVADLSNDRSDMSNKGQFEEAIKNEDGTALVQTLRGIAAEAGRDPVQLGLVPATDIDSYVENLSKLLTGVEIVFVRRPGKDAFKKRLEVKRIYPRSVVDNPGKKFKGLTLQWES